jgi:uncharacterized membrane protein YqhA
MHKIIKVAVTSIVCLILLNSIVFIGLAIYKSIHAYVLLWQGHLEEKPGVQIAESLDSFMVALFFMIFSLGIAKLFLPKTNFLSDFDLPWLRVDNFSQLKYIMWEMLLTTIFVFYSTKLIINENRLEWNLLIFPGSILMLALAFKLLRQPH